MNLFAPFTGTLYLPDRAFLAAGSPVLLADGRTIAAVQWRTWSHRFEVLDATGTTVATCAPAGILRRRYVVQAVDGRVLVDLRPGLWRIYNDAELSVASGSSLEIHQTSMWSHRRFEFHAPAGMVGRIEPTTGSFSFRPDSYEFELLAPALSAIEAISLAQVLRVMARAHRQRSTATS